AAIKFSKHRRPESEAAAGGSSASGASKGRRSRFGGASAAAAVVEFAFLLVVLTLVQIVSPPGLRGVVGLPLSFEVAESFLRAAEDPSGGIARQVMHQ